MQFNENFDESSQLPDKISRAEKAISLNPYDIEAWNVLLRDSQTKRIEDARPLYERLIGQYPNSGRFWRLYIEHEMKAKCYDKVEKLFQRCLLKVFHIDIWKLYLSYIKETKVNLPVYREKMAQAYDFALDKIGMDVNSYSIWVEYISFLKSVEAVGSYAENQKISAVRKVYQKGILNPMVNVDLFWKDYCNFENNINPLIAKKMQEDRSRDYTNAKRVAKEFETVTKGINKNAPSVPPRNTPEETKQVELWKKYIQWEKSNPLRTEDQTIITKRVMFAYEQCFLCLGLHPDVWIEAATFLEDSSKMLNERGSNVAGKMFAEEASGIYERALSMGLKNCLLIYFAYADMEESRMKYEKVHSIYKRALELKDVETTLVYIQYMRFARRAEGIKSSRAIFKQAREDQRTKYHVYVTAARMEHYNNKDNGVALRIFELAFKRFGGQHDFVKEFLDYSMNVNDDNNTRVLYERILTSGVEPHEMSLEVWNKFVEFEANVGSLSSIFSSEKRRLQVFGKEFEGKETSLVIDRYKFLDLFPCNATELKAMGLKEPTKAVPYSVSTSFTENGPEPYINSDLDEVSRTQKGKVYTPDLCQMMPFKPKMNDMGCAIPGGVFAQPSCITDLMKYLPPPSCFSGPFVRVEQFMEYLLTILVPDDCSQLESEVDLSRVDPGTLHSISLGNLKRKRTDSLDEDDTSPISHSNPYMARQQKRNKF